MTDTNLQIPLFEPKSDWTPPLVGELPDWGNAKRVGVDVETYDPHLRELGPGVRRGGYITGYSFALEDGPKYYVPLRHGGGDNVADKDLALDYLRNQAKHFKGLIVGANLSYDLDYLSEEGVDFTSTKFFRDVLVADPLIYELHLSYSLNNVAKRWGFPGKEEDLLIAAAAAHSGKKKNQKLDPKKDMWRLPARYVGPYAAEDAELPLKVLRKQEVTIEEQDLWQVFDLESRLLPALVRMRRRGVRIDLQKLEEIEQWALQEEREAVQIIQKHTGHDIGIDNVWKADALAKPLKSIGVRLNKTSTGKDNIDKFVLAGIDHPVADAILWARKTNKLRTTFAASVRRYVIGDRLHPILNQLKGEKDDESNTKGAAYGRMSGEHPNIQQQPSRDEFANMWRSIYIPEEGYLWACNDYSQQEPRWTTHYAEKTGCTRAKDMGDAYRQNPDTDNHDMMTTLIHGISREDVERDKFEKLRKPCKDIYLGLCYGMGGAKLARSIGADTRFMVSVNWNEKYYADTRVEAQGIAKEVGGRIWEVAGEEAQGVLDKFDEKAPFVRELSKKVEKTAKQRGYIRTALGRHCHFPTDDQGNYDWTHKALNRLIQGSSGDQAKAAIVALDNEGYFVHFPVHDETDSSVKDVKEAEQIAEIMATIVPMTVPSKVDVEIGPSWGEIK